MYFHPDATYFLPRVIGRVWMDHWRESIIPFPLDPPHPGFFGSRTRHASAPARRRFPSPPSVSLSPLPPRVYPIRRDTLCPPFHHAIHLPNFADQTYVHCSQYSLPVMLSKCMNCSSVERN